MGNEMGREKEREKTGASMEVDNDDSIAEVDKKHFEEAMKFARRSVSDHDIRKYEMFSQTLQQSRGFGPSFKFPESAATVGEAVAASGINFEQQQDDDLYS